MVGKEKGVMKKDTKNLAKKRVEQNIAVAGSGYWGKNLIRNYAALGALRMICDNNELLLEQFKSEYSDVRTCLAFHDVLCSSDITGVVIATPAETHFALAREALLAGKHVYVEKPLVLHEKEAEELIALAEERHQVLMVGHLLQYHPVFRRLQKIVREGELGRIDYIYSHRLNLGKIRREENILWSFAPHDISMILSLAGEDPESVIATGGNYLHSRIADVTTTHLEFSSGLRAHVFVSWLHPFKEQKLVVVGNRKMAVFDDTKSWSDKLLLYPHEITWQNHLPVPARGEPERVVDIPEAEPLRLECEHFLDCICNRQQPLTDGREGLHVLRVLNASQLSLNSQGRKITLKDLDDSKALLPRQAEDYYVHETAVIDEGASIGKRTKIWHFSHILKDTTVGEDCNMGQNVVIGPNVTIGNRCKIQNNVSIYQGVILEDGVFCGPSMVFTNVYNPRAEIRKMDEARPTIVKRGATIGANATVVCGNSLGEYAFVGAGAVVTKDVPPHALVVGNPARQIGWVCECGERLPKTLLCPVCQKQYHKSTAGILYKS